MVSLCLFLRLPEAFVLNTISLRFDPFLWARVVSEGSSAHLQSQAMDPLSIIGSSIAVVQVSVLVSPYRTSRHFSGSI